MQNTIDSHSHTRQQKHNQSQNTRYRIPYTNIRMSTNQTPGIKNHTKNGPTRPSRHSTYEFIDIYSMCDRLFCLLVTNSLQFFSQPLPLSLPAIGMLYDSVCSLLMIFYIPWRIFRMELMGEPKYKYSFYLRFSVASRFREVHFFRSDSTLFSHFILFDSMYFVSAWSYFGVFFSPSIEFDCWSFHCMYRLEPPDADSLIRVIKSAYNFRTSKIPIFDLNN